MTLHARSAGLMAAVLVGTSLATVFLLNGEPVRRVRAADSVAAEVWEHVRGFADRRSTDVRESSDWSLTLDEAALARPALSPRRRLLCFGAKWCAPCVAEKPAIVSAAAAAGWTCSDRNDADVQLIDVDESPITTAKYRITRLPACVLIDTDGGSLRHVTGAGGWRNLFAELTATPSAPRGVTVGRLAGARPAIKTFLETLRPLLGTGGTLAITYRGPHAPRIAVAGAEIRFAPQTTLKWSTGSAPSSAASGVRVEFDPPPTIQIGKLGVGFRGLKLTEDRIVVDIPWLPDAEIALE